MIVSVSRLKLKSYRYLPEFLWLAAFSLIQAWRTKGHRSTSVRNRWLIEHFTLSSWESHQAMMDFVLSPAHKKAMEIHRKVTQSSRTLHFEAEKVPSWPEALKRLEEEGHTSLE